MYKALVVFFMLIMPVITIAAKVDSVVVKKAPAPAMQYDTARPLLRSFDQAAIDQYHNDKAFKYVDKVTELSLWERFWNAVWEFLARLFGNKAATQTNDNTAAKYLALGLVVLLIIYLVVKAMGDDLANIFRRGSKEVSIAYNESIENIHEISFDDELEKAVSNKNYKLVIRLLYLRTLKQLSDAQLIHWQIEKTNSAYVNELTNDDQRQSFAVLTRQFEYIWYGDLPVNERSFQNIQTLFNDFKKLLP